MTPFMVRVDELVEGADGTHRPGIRESEPRSVVEGADEQVMTRSLAEQLVSEANAVLSVTGRAIDLTDELLDGQLSFIMRFADRVARVSTSFGDGASVGHLQGVGAAGTGGVALDGPDELEELILLLIGSGLATAASAAATA